MATYAERSKLNVVDGVIPSQREQIPSDRTIAANTVEAVRNNPAAHTGPVDPTKISGYMMQTEQVPEDTDDHDGELLVPQYPPVGAQPLSPEKEEEIQEQTNITDKEMGLTG